MFLYIISTSPTRDDVYRRICRTLIGTMPNNISTSLNNLTTRFQRNILSSILPTNILSNKWLLTWESNPLFTGYEPVVIIRFTRQLCLVALPRFELGHHRFKAYCLTVWLESNVREKYERRPKYFSQLYYIRIVTPISLRFK